MRSGSKTKLGFLTTAAFVAAMAMAGNAMAISERPARPEPEKPEVVKPAPVPPPVVPKKPAVKKAHKAVHKKPAPKRVAKRVAHKPSAAAPEVTYDVGHMAVPSSIAAPVQAGGTAEALAHPSPVLSAPAEATPPVLAASGPPAEVLAKARPGQCFAQLMTAPVTEAIKQDVKIAAHQEKRQIRERSEWADETYVSSPARKVTLHVPDSFRDVRETVVVSPATTREVTIAAKYERRTERVMRVPERQVWVLTDTAGAHRPDGKLDWPGKTRTDGDGRVWCLQTLPAEFETVTQSVEVSPAHVERVEVPAITQVIERRVLDIPAHDEVIETSPIYGVRKVKKVIETSHEAMVDVPEAVETRTVVREVTPGQPVWAEVLCLKSVSRAKMVRIQTALKARGYFRGRPDGQPGPRTLKAMDDFQTAKGLPRGRISVAGLRALGVE